LGNSEKSCFITTGKKVFSTKSFAPGFVDLCKATIKSPSNNGSANNGAVSYKSGIRKEKRPQKGEGKRVMRFYLEERFGMWEEGIRVASYQHSEATNI